MTFWHMWHEDYEDPNSDLSHRLAAVQDSLRAAIEEAPPGPIRLISACAGEGRDVAGALQNHARARDVRGVLVELDGELSARAQRNMHRSGLDGIQVRQADAGYSGAYEGAVPADVLLLCGIFGNVSPRDVHNTVVRSKMLCAPNAIVIWTRHRRTPDRSPTIRGWFRDAGFTEIGFDSPGVDQFAVCAERLVDEPHPFSKDVHLFTFVDYERDMAW